MIELYLLFPILRTFASVIDYIVLVKFKNNFKKECIMDMTDAKVVEKKIYEDGKKTEYASKGVAGTALGLGIAGTALGGTSLADR